MPRLSRTALQPARAMSSRLGSWAWPWFRKRFVVAVMLIGSACGAAVAAPSVVPRVAAPPPPTESLKAPIGTIKGNWSTTGSGAAGYSMPLVVPPGVAGLTPDLAIAWNSQAGDNALGPQFAITGIEQIARCPATAALDGAAGGITFDTQDRFCLNGQWLVTSDTYGAVNAVYRTESEIWWDVRSVGGSAGAPDHWVVRTKTGLTLRFGSSPASRFTSRDPLHAGSVLVWLLHTTTDTPGNEIRYEYEFPVGESGSSAYYLTAVRWGGNPKQKTPNNLALSLTYRPANGFRPKGFMRGHPIAWDRLLSRITASVDGRPGRDWKFEYASGGSGAPILRERVVGLRECVGSVCLPATRFKWAARKPPKGLLSPVNFESGLGASEPFVASGDFDRRGGQDLLAFGVDNDGNGKGWIWSGGSSDAAPYRWSAEGLSPTGRAAASDFDGDGLTDLAWMGGGSVDTWFAKGEGMEKQVTAKLPTGSKQISDAVFAGDFDGDGRNTLQLLGLPDASGMVSGYQVQWLGRSTKVVPLQYVIPHFLSGASTAWQVAPLGGRAAMEAFVSWRTAEPAAEVHGACAFPFRSDAEATCLSVPPRAAVLKLADINGDGLPDLLSMRQDADKMQIRGRANSGSAGGPVFEKDLFNVTVKLPSLDAYAPIVGNFDGHQQQMLVLVEEAPVGSKARILPVQLSDSTAVAGETLTVSTGARGRGILVADQDGDGRDELLFVESVDRSTRISAISVGSSGVSDVVSITNGLGATVEFTYRWTSDQAIYEDDGTAAVIGSDGNPFRTPVAYPMATLCEPISVVAQVRSPSPGEEDRLLAFHYRNARLIQGGRGFAGFSEVISRGSGSGGDTVTRFAQNFPFVGLPIFTESDEGALTAVRRSYSKFKDEITSHSSHFVHADAIEETTFRRGAGVLSPIQVKRTRASAYDSLGGILEWTDAFEPDTNGARYVIGSKREYKNNEKQWFLDRVTRALSVQLVSGRPVAAVGPDATYTYDPSTALLSSSHNQQLSPPGWHREDLERDAFGNIQRILITRSDGARAESRSEWSVQGPYFGRFATRECDFHGSCVRRTFDPATGRRIDEIAADGEVTRRHYDASGRSAGTDVTSADGQLRSWTRITLRRCAEMSGDGCHRARFPTAAHALETRDSVGNVTLVLRDVTDKKVGTRNRSGANSAWVDSDAATDEAVR